MRRIHLVTPLLLAGWLPACEKCSSDEPEDLRASSRIPTLQAVRLAPGAITIDGELNEPAWKRAGSTGPFVGPRDGKPKRESPVNANARVTWDRQHLYFGFVVLDRRPSSPFSADDVDPHIWERSSAVELMIQPGDPGNNEHYYEVQVDVAGAVWDTRFDDYNEPITASADGQGKRYGHQSWRSRVKKGIVVDRARGRYTVELALPWGALPSAHAKTPPENGDTWRINLYSFRDGQRHALAWSPTLGQGNFHRSSRFGRVRFVVR